MCFQPSFGMLCLWLLISVHHLLQWGKSPELVIHISDFHGSFSESSEFFLPIES